MSQIRVEHASGILMLPSTLRIELENRRPRAKLARAPESDSWMVAGDGLPEPSPLNVRGQVQQPSEVAFKDLVEFWRQALATAELIADVRGGYVRSRRLHPRYGLEVRFVVAPWRGRVEIRLYPRDAEWNQAVYAPALVDSARVGGSFVGKESV